MKAKFKVSTALLVSSSSLALERGTFTIMRSHLASLLAVDTLAANPLAHAFSLTPTYDRLQAKAALNTIRRIDAESLRFDLPTNGQRCSNSILWHRRLIHCNNRVLLSIASSNPDTIQLDCSSLPPCVSCLCGKAHKLPFPHFDNNVLKIGDVVVSARDVI
jgi:hypothetical protein